MDFWKIFKIGSAAMNLVALYEQAMADKKLTKEEVMLILTQGIAPLFRALGKEMPSFDLPEATIPPTWEHTLAVMGKE